MNKKYLKNAFVIFLMEIILFAVLIILHYTVWVSILLTIITLGFVFLVVFLRRYINKIYQPENPNP
jgi:c-di-AMP phosphodiesterase-like protein